jgi:hypothetical protein
MIDGHKVASKKCVQLVMQKRVKRGCKVAFKTKWKKRPNAQGGPPLRCGGQPWKSTSLQVE